MAPSDETSAMRLSYAVGRLDHTLSQAIGQAVAPLGLTTAQYTTLSIVAAQPSLSNAQLARRAFVRPQSMNQMLSGLERDGLLRRAQSPQHSRILHLDLSAEGRRVLGRCEARIEELEAAMLDGIEPKERRRLSEAIARMTANLREVSG